MEFECIFLTVLSVEHVLFDCN